MFDTLLLRPSLHCNTPLHFTTLHPTTLHDTPVHFTTLHHTSPNYTSLYFATLYHTSPQFTQLHFTTLRYTSSHFTQLHFTTLRQTSPHFTQLYFTTLIDTSLFLIYFTSLQIACRQTKWGGYHLCHHQKILTSILLGRLKKITKNPRPGNRCLRRDSNMALPKYTPVILSLHQTSRSIQGPNFVVTKWLTKFQHLQQTGAFISLVLCTHHVKLSEFTHSYTKQSLKFKLVDFCLRLSSFAHNSGKGTSQAASAQLKTFQHGEYHSRQ